MDLVELEMQFGSNRGANLQIWRVGAFLGLYFKV
jgi:hypothetical protein